MLMIRVEGHSKQWEAASVSAELHNNLGSDHTCGLELGNCKPAWQSRGKALFI